MSHHQKAMSSLSFAASPQPPPAVARDEMECALDGVDTREQAEARWALAAAQADQDPELIMLALRGLPVYPHPCTPDTAATPEAAFVVAGGPTCMIREMLLPPYPLEDAPAQLYQAMEQVRRLQASSEFKAGVVLLGLILRVWRKKHLWKVLRESPSMTLAEGLEEDVRRTEERRLRAIYREEERLRREAEEAEFARKMAETEAEGGEGAADAAQAAQPADEARASDSESDSDSDLDDDHTGASTKRTHVPNADGSDAHGAADSGDAQQHKHHSHHGHGHHHHKKQHELADQPDEVLEFPEVSSEEELEFIVYFYNALGSLYQSAASAPSLSAGSGMGSRGAGSAPPAGGDGSGGVRWGRMRVIPIAAAHPAMKAMMAGTRRGAQLGSSVSSAQLLPPCPELDDLTEALHTSEGRDPLDLDAEFLATSPDDPGNNSNHRALIAFWQAKVAHDIYGDLKAQEEADIRAIRRAEEAAAKGNKEEEDDGSNGGGGGGGADDDRGSSSMNLNGSSSSGSDGALLLNPHTTLSHPAFSSLNVPGLSLSALRAESKSMGLFGFGSSQHQQQHERDRENMHIFWSTQPIIAGAAPSTRVNMSESSKSLSALFGATASSTSMAQLHSTQPSAASASSAAGTALPSASLLNPYAHCAPADALTYSNLGAVLSALGNFVLALRCNHVGLQIRLATLRPEEDEFVDVATSLNNIGVVLANLGLFSSAGEHFEAARELASQRLDPVHPRINILAGNIGKVSSRRRKVPDAPGLLEELRTMAANKERKEYEAQEKRNAKANKKGKGGAAAAGGAARSGSAASARPSARKAPPPGKKGELPPPEFHEDPRYFQKPVEGQPPVVPPKRAEGAPLQPMGTAAAAITTMPLRQWDVQMGEMQKMLLEFGPAKKKAAASAAPKKKK